MLLRGRWKPKGVRRCLLRITMVHGCLRLHQVVEFIFVVERQKCTNTTSVYSTLIAMNVSLWGVASVRACSEEIVYRSQHRLLLYHDRLVPIEEILRTASVRAQFGESDDGLPSCWRAWPTADYRDSRHNCCSASWRASGWYCTV